MLPTTGAAESPDGSQLVDRPDELRLVDLRVSLRGLTLVRDLNIEVTSGETLAVMGRSGVGKTSLLRVIAGLIPAAGGEVIRPAGRVSMVFQDPRLLPWRTARRNIEVALGGVPRAERHRIAEAWLARVGLADAADVYPAALSGGMRQRVAIARALAVPAPVVLVDEPFSSLDALTAQTLRAEFRAHLRDAGRVVVWVTHSQAEAEAVADRILVLDGPPEGSWRIITTTDAEASGTTAGADVPATIAGAQAPVSPGADAPTTPDGRST